MSEDILNALRETLEELEAAAAKLKGIAWFKLAVQIAAIKRKLIKMTGPQLPDLENRDEEIAALKALTDQAKTAAEYSQERALFVDQAIDKLLGLIGVDLD